MSAIELPPLPEPQPRPGGQRAVGYTAAQMRDYALAALAQPAAPDAQPEPCTEPGCFCHVFTDNPASKSVQKRLAVQRADAQPVAWLGGDGHPHHISAVQTATERRIYGTWVPLYAAAQAAPQPHKGLTVQVDDEGGVWLAFSPSTGRKARLNVGNIAGSMGVLVGEVLRDWVADAQAAAGITAAPHEKPAPQPLTPEKIDEIYRALPNPVEHWQLARAIERAHGITAAPTTDKECS